MLVKGALKIPCQSVNEIMSYVRKCMNSRVVANTNQNLESSRSHCVIRIFITKYFKSKQGMDMKLMHVLSFTDLAGSESIKFNDSALTQKEAVYINKSLLSLG